MEHKQRKRHNNRQFTGIFTSMLRTTDSLETCLTLCTLHNIFEHTIRILKSTYVVLVEWCHSSSYSNFEYVVRSRPLYLRLFAHDDMIRSNYADVCPCMCKTYTRTFLQSKLHRCLDDVLICVSLNQTLVCVN